MLTLYHILILIVSYIGGLIITRCTILTALFWFTFRIPLTIDLEKGNLLVKNHPILRGYWGSVTFLTIVFCGITILIFKFSSSLVQIGYFLGIVSVFFNIIFDLNKIGMNQMNVSDYVQTNSKYFNGAVKGPVEDVLNFIYIKSFTNRADVFSSKIAIKEGLMGAELKARALEIFKDAVRIAPETPEGKFTREESQKYARQITQLNKNYGKHNVQRNVDSDVVSQVAKEVEETARKINVNRLAMKDLDDFKHIPLTPTYLNTWLDTANFIASEIARKESKIEQELTDRATEIFKDAVRIVPETKEGHDVRTVAQSSAKLAT